MKNENSISRIRAAWGAALRYWCNHAASQRAMNKLYVRNYRDEKAGENYTVLLGINPEGSIYRITQLFYRGGVYSHEHSWLATYGWHSNGHLIALGRSICYLIFNPLQKSVYMEMYGDSEETITELYTQV